MTFARCIRKLKCAAPSAVALVIGLLAGCGGDKSTGPSDPPNTEDASAELVVTEAQAGVWRTTSAYRDCATGSLAEQDSLEETYQAGDNLFHLTDPGEERIYTITHEEGGYLIRWSGSFTLDGCTQVISETYHLKFTNESKTAMTAHGQIISSLSGSGCDPSEAGCVNAAITGTRVGPTAAPSRL
jgi:hypothetical protein